MYWTLDLASKLSDAPFPCTLSELLEWATRSGCPDEILENLNEMLSTEEDIEYQSIEELWPDYPTKDDFFFNEEEY